MAPPPVTLFLTSIASAPKLRQRQEYITRILQVTKTPYTTYDLASNEDAKKLWKRKAPLQHQQLPGILVGNAWPGTFEQFEEAVECGEIRQFLRQNEEWDSDLYGDGKPALAVQPVAVPGAARPSEITNQRPSFAPKSSNTGNTAGGGDGSGKRGTEIDVSDELGEFGLRDVKVTNDELAELVKDLGLGDDDAADFIKGLGGSGGGASSSAGLTTSTSTATDKDTTTTATTSTNDKGNTPPQTETEPEKSSTTTAADTTEEPAKPTLESENENKPAVATTTTEGANTTQKEEDKKEGS